MENKSLIQNFQRDIDTGQSSILDRYIGGSYTDHNPPPTASKTPGMAGLKETFDIALSIFSEFKHVIEDQLSEGDKVVTRITGTGRHVGPLLGIAATDKMVTMSGIAIHRVENGRLVEHWGQVDAVGLLTQVGAIPASPVPPSMPSPQIARTSGDRVLSADGMKQTLRRFFEEAVNQRNRAAAEQLIHPHAVNYSMPMPKPGPQGFEALVDMFFAAFPDLEITVEDIIAENDKAATRGYFTGTHRGTFLNVPATGRSVRVGFIDIWKAYQGQLIENWVQMDMLGALVQLGAMPAPGA